MRKVVLKDKTSFSSSKLWDLITDLNNYPKYVKFLKKIEFEKPLSMESQFWDITTIAYIPLKIIHAVDIFEKEKALGFYVKMPVTGYMKQRAKIYKIGDRSELELSIEFDFQNKLFDLVFGKFLEKRVRDMLLYILESGKRLTNGK